MALLHTPLCNFGTPAPEFKLPGVDGRVWTLGDCKGPNGLLVMFICNHCPYVKSIQNRMVRDTAELQQFGIGSVAIMSNDPLDYPEDSFENMKRVAEQYSFPFPYLLDESQDVAKSFGAVCTPDFFGYDRNGGLQYRGRIDESGRQPARPDARRDLFEAMRLVAETGHGPREQNASMGCSIKWRHD